MSIAPRPLRAATDSGGELAPFLTLGDRVRFEAGLEADAGDRPVIDWSRFELDGGRSDLVSAPTAGLTLGMTASMPAGNEIFIRLGGAFDSQDARSTVLGGASEIPSRTITYELGARTQPLRGLDIVAAAWWLDLDSVLVLLDGPAEPTPNAHPWGLDLEARYDLAPGLEASSGFVYAQTDRRHGERSAVLLHGGLTAEVTRRLSLALRVTTLAGTGGGDIGDPRAVVFDVAIACRWSAVQHLHCGEGVDGGQALDDVPVAQDGLGVRAAMSLVF